MTDVMLDDPLDYYYPKPTDYPQLNFTDEKNNIKDRLVIVEDPKQYFEPITFDDNKNCANILDTPDYGFHGHPQLLDRMTSTPFFPNLIFIASKTHVHAYNVETKLLKEFYKYECVQADYGRITALKAYKNYLFIGGTYGDVVKVTMHSETKHETVQRNTPSMKNGFCFYEYNGKDYAMVASNNGAEGLETYEIDSMTLINSLRVPLPEYYTCLGGVSISPSKRFFIGIGDKREIYVYEIVPDGLHCTYKLRRAMGVSGNCHTADWAPDESCFAVTCEYGECYLFSFKEVDDDVHIKLQAVYQSPNFQQDNPLNYYQRLKAIEVVKFHPKASVPIMVFTVARQMKIFVVDYTTFSIVQTFSIDEFSEELINNGIEFSLDGRSLFVQYCDGSWIGKGGKLITLKLKEVGTLASICLEYLRKNKAQLDAQQLQQILPDTLLEKLSLNNN